jgi:hypothetical protein
MHKRNSLSLDEAESILLAIDASKPDTQMQNSFHAENIGVRKMLVRRRDVALNVVFRILKMVKLVGKVKKRPKETNLNSNSKSRRKRITFADESFNSLLGEKCDVGAGIHGEPNIDGCGGLLEAATNQANHQTIVLTVDYAINRKSHRREFCRTQVQDSFFQAELKCENKLPKSR